MAGLVDRENMMEIEQTALEGVLLIKPKVHSDDRGHFLETFTPRLAEAIGMEWEFVQDNESMSAANVLRGLHYQESPHAQGKLVRVVCGAVLDVAVDIRPGSTSFGRHVAIELNDRNKHMLWIPPGFAHGFRTLEDRTVFVYKCTAPYHHASERTIRWNDADLGIDWGTRTPLVSAKDNNGMDFRSFMSSRPDTAPLP